jgi:hypothetical protein
LEVVVPQTSWDQLSGCESGSAPAISAHEDGWLYIVAVSPAGQVEFTRIKKLKDDWSNWEIVNSIPQSGRLLAAWDSSPVLCRARNHRLYLLCRGADNNLYMTNRLGENDWAQWKSLTNDGSVRGRISVTVTESPWHAHLLFSGPNHTVHYRRFDSNWSLDGAPYQWPNMREGEVASDGDDELFVALRDMGDNLLLRRLRFPWSAALQPVVTPHGTELGRFCFSLSNIVYFGGDFHVLYATRALLDDISSSYAYSLAHTRIRANQYDDSFLRVVYDYQPSGGRTPQATLANYRNKLVTAISDENAMIRYAWLDTSDPKTLWIGCDVVSLGRTQDRPALGAIDFRTYLRGDGEYLESNFGNDLFAAVRGVTANSLWYINFSRALFKNHLKSIGHDVDWCTKYTGPRAMEDCPAQPGVPSTSELPVYSEVGFGSMTMPYWLMSIVFPRIMQYEGHPNESYMTWVHTSRIKNPYIGPHINVDYTHNEKSWHHEMMHRLATNMALWNKNANQPNPNLMTDYFPDYLVAAATTLFRDQTNDSQNCLIGTAEGGRCRGFTGASGNYDVGDCQHSFVELVRYYTENGAQLRAFVYSDLRAGTDLLRRKYDWVREHIFRGVEFSTQGMPIYPVCIINKHSGKALDVTSWSLADNAPIQQYSPHRGNNQRWLLLPQSGGQYHVMAMHSGLCLDLAGVSQENGAKVQQFTRHNGPNQQWALIPDMHGAYEIVAQHSNKCLEVAGWSMSDGSAIVQYDRHGGDNQKWILEHADGRV